MTVKELKEILETIPEEYTVNILATYDDGYGLTGGYISDCYKDGNTFVLYSNEG